MTTKELLTTEEFRKELEINITTYTNRPLPKKGQYYRRTPYDELKQRHMFNVEELRKEYVRILAKESNLSCSQRQAVTAIVHDALFKAFNKLNKKDEQQEEKPAIPKKKRTRKKDDAK